MLKEIIQVLDHLPRWAYTDSEWKEQVLDKTEYIKDGIRYEKIIIEEPDPEIDEFINNMM